MTVYRDQPFSTRYASLGNEAESVLEAAHPLGAVERYGWHKPANIKMRNMPIRLRNQPDYYSDSGHLIEVMGLGRDGILKGMKLTKWESYKVWKKVCNLLGIYDLVTFVWNSYTEQYAILSYEQMKGLIGKGRRRGVESFNDGNEYVPILWSDIESTVDRLGVWHVDL